MSVFDDVAERSSAARQTPSGDAVAADEPEHALTYILEDEEGRQMFGLTDPNRGERFIATDTTMEIRQ